jgi:hypothetical protein
VDDAIIRLKALGRVEVDGADDASRVFKALSLISIGLA